MTAERAAWVALALTPGIGASRMRYLLAACHTAYGALTAPFSLICAIPGLSGAVATALKQRTLAEGEEDRGGITYLAQHRREAGVSRHEHLGAESLRLGDRGLAVGKAPLLERRRYGTGKTRDGA